MEWNGSGNDKPANDNDSGFDFDDHDSSSCTYTGIPAVLLAVGDFWLACPKYRQCVSQP